VTTLLDLDAELGKLTMFRGRTPTSTREDRKGSNARLASYRDAGIFVSKSAGRGAWERHPDGDEFVYVVEGDATLHVVSEAGSQSFPVSAGKLAIVPAGAWHRFDYPQGVTLLTITPGRSEFVRADVVDPFSVEATRD
jgi:mannose-6-phosphate isomerase-like protein (cupin superfamily)